MNDQANFPSKSEALKLPRTNGYRIGVGEIAIVVKGRKIAKGSYGMVLAFSAPKFYGHRGRLVVSTVSALVMSPDGEHFWVNSDNLEKLTLNNWEQTVLTVRAGKSRAEFIKKAKYEIDEETYLDLCVMVSAQLDKWSIQSVAKYFTEAYYPTSKAA